MKRPKKIYIEPAIFDSNQWFESKPETHSVEYIRADLVKKMKTMYKECFENFIPVEKWDEATAFLSTYGNDLAKDILKRGL